MPRRYYIVCGVMAEKPYKQWRRMPDPDDPRVGSPYTLLRIKPKGTLRVVFCGGPAGNLLLSGLDEESAFEVIDAIEGYLALTEGWVRGDSDLPSFYALARVPNRSWNDERLLLELQQESPDLSDLQAKIQVKQIRSGIALHDAQQHNLQQYVTRIMDNPSLRESLRYFRESRRTFNGYMTGSYYHFHYRHDRRSMRARQLERKYRHYRAQYETAFVAAFKALERLLGVNQIRNQSDSLLDCLKPDVIRSNASYRRMHEIFRELPQDTTYGEMAAHFLQIRNIVAAHANRSPPTKFAISEDNLYEIQYFLSDLYYAVIGKVEEYELPSYKRRRSRPRG